LDGASKAGRAREKLGATLDDRMADESRTFAEAWARHKGKRACLVNDQKTGVRKRGNAVAWNQLLSVELLASNA